MSSIAADAMDWQSEEIPPSVARPWHVFKAELDRLTLHGRGKALEHTLALRRFGAFGAFLRLPVLTQRAFAEVSLAELAAYEQWLSASKKASELSSETSAAADVMAATTVASTEDGADLQTSKQQPAVEKAVADGPFLRRHRPEHLLRQAAWDKLDADTKAEWLPDDGQTARALLAALPKWGPLLGEGPPPCGNPPTVTSDFSRGLPLEADVAGAGIESCSEPCQYSRPIRCRGRLHSSVNCDFMRRGGRGRQQTASVLTSTLAAMDDCTASSLVDFQCSVCGLEHASQDNDLAQCDLCNKGFHQNCHEPPVSSFGRSSDKWFCAACNEKLAGACDLRSRPGDLVWTKGPRSLCWPALVLAIDFSGNRHSKPYKVQLIDCGVSVPEGVWRSDESLIPWHAGPKLVEMQDHRQRTAVKLAKLLSAEAKHAEHVDLQQPQQTPRAANVEHDQFKQTHDQSSNAAADQLVADDGSNARPTGTVLQLVEAAETMGASSAQSVLERGTNPLTPPLNQEIQQDAEGDQCSQSRKKRASTGVSNVRQARLDSAQARLDSWLMREARLDVYEEINEHTHESYCNSNGQHVVSFIQKENDENDANHANAAAELSSARALPPALCDSDGSSAESNPTRWEPKPMRDCARVTDEIMEAGHSGSEASSELDADDASDDSLGRCKSRRCSKILQSIACKQRVLNGERMNSCSASPPIMTPPISRRKGARRLDKLSGTQLFSAKRPRVHRSDSSWTSGTDKFGNLAFQLEAIRGLLGRAQTLDQELNSDLCLG